MTFRLVQIDFHRVDMQTRLPFRYGIATMSEVPHLLLSVIAEVDGRRSRGIAADGLAPKWFTKDPETSYLDEDLPEMLRSIRHAADVAVSLRRQPSLFDWWWELYHAQHAWGTENGVPALLSGFGCSLMERAAIDSLCRARRVSLSNALRSDGLGIELNRLRPELPEQTVADILPSKPTEKLNVRHTVGLADPLYDQDIDAGSRLDDGLPQSLEQAIRLYGLRYFKIKLSGTPEQDLTRLVRLRRLLQTEVGDAMRFTLDGNEQYNDLQSFREAWSAFRADQSVADMLDQQLLFVEQPLHRDVALEEDVGEAIRRWREGPPIIIDESDSEFDSFPRAIDLGYAGTSHKNCKGIFKSLANAATISQRTRSNRPLLLSAEDLGNVGPIALLQDLAVVASLGISHAERNGHHYFAGLSQFPESMQKQIFAEHGDLYDAHPEGYPTLRLATGQLDLKSVVRSPFGLAQLPVFDQLPIWNF